MTNVTICESRGCNRIFKCYRHEYNKTKEQVEGKEKVIFDCSKNNGDFFIGSEDEYKNLEKADK